MPKIRIHVDKQGNPKILDVVGAGTNCIEATKNFEKMLGQASEENRVLTENFYDELPPQELTQEGDG